MRDQVDPKKPFDIHLVMERLRAAVAGVPKAAMFELAEEGFTSPFEQLVACLISVRTRDEVSLPVSRQLFRHARTPASMLALTTAEIDQLIRRSTFHERKARQIHVMAGRIMQEFGGQLPCDKAVLESFDGIGPKCANLTLGIACGQARVSADIHVHRVTNRWGYVQTRSPERTSMVLEEILPEQYQVEINSLLVPFGKHICTGPRPRCPVCPLLDMCRQVGVVNRQAE
jgi:endonuclease III